jgi:hypothetical protein
MPEVYNPIVRTFCQFRAVLLNSLDLSRQEVRPNTPLETLLPMSCRREVWTQLQRQGLRLPALELSEWDHRRNLLRALRAAVSSAVYLHRWSALVLILPLALAFHWASRRRAVHFPLGLATVGQMVIYTTCFAEHKGSGYRWTKNEIALKVRLIVAESVGFPLEAVQPETKLVDLC